MRDFRDYQAAHASRRLNDPSGYIEYLRQQPRFRDCPLGSLPALGIIWHDNRIEEHLAILGFSQADYRTLSTGTTDPNVVYIVYGNDERPDVCINAGMPGAGGISTQAAELAAMGVRFLVHVGTCGLVGERVTSGMAVVSDGSYKDAAAVMLARDAAEAADPIAHPDPRWTAAIHASLDARKIPSTSAVGYTIPIFYYQPYDLVRGLVDGSAFPKGPPIGYFEMEEATFFATCAQASVCGASVVLGSDRYVLEGAELVHRFEEDVDQDRGERDIFLAILDAYRRVAPAPTNAP